MSETNLSIFNQQSPSVIVPKIVDFVPFLSVAYGVSQVVSEGRAKPGDFMLGDQNIGKEILAVYIDYRSHASVWDKSKNSPESNFYVGSTNTVPLENHEEWQRYSQQKLVGDKVLNIGVDALLWLVEHKTPAIFFMKNTLLSFFTPLCNASIGGRAVKISTEMILNPKNRKTRCKLQIGTTNRAAIGSTINVTGMTINRDIDTPRDILNSSIEKFRSFKNEEFVMPDEVVDRDR